MLCGLARTAGTVVRRSATRVVASTRAHSGKSLFEPSPEHQSLRDMIARFSKEQIDPQAAEFDNKGQLNKDLFKKAAEMNLFGITVPEADGGVGMDAVASVIVHHEMSKYDPGWTLAYLAHSLLFVNNFYYASNAEQKKRYLHKVLSGEWMGGMGMTEPGVGSDVLGMSTNAKKQGGHYVLNGAKTYITNGVEGQVFLVYAKVDGKLSTFIVEKAFPGFHASQKIDKIGMRGSTMATLTFEDCKVPVENLIGKEGQGVTHMMRNLEIERIGLAAMSVGIAERCVELMLQYSEDRKAFGKNLHEFGQIQRYIADGFAMTEAAKALTYSVAHYVGPGIKNRIGTDAAKLFASPVGTQVANWAMQVAGGMGYCREYPAERLWRDAKLLEIGGGTLEMHEKNMTKDLVAAKRQGTPPTHVAYTKVE